jgi:hypothetical protein
VPAESLPLVRDGRMEVRQRPELGIAVDAKALSLVSRRIGDRVLGRAGNGQTTLSGGTNRSIDGGDSHVLECLGLQGSRRRVWAGSAACGHVPFG